MAWYVFHLLKNRIEIRSKLDLESDEYNDLLVIEKTISDLHNAGIISDSELRLIEYVQDGKSISNSKKNIGKGRVSLSKDFNNLCDKIAFYKGGYFTDDGYADYMKTKYNLTDEQINKMIDYMRSKYRNKLIRKTDE